jgi:hypothetical protein
LVAVLCRSRTFGRYSGLLCRTPGREFDGGGGAYLVSYFEWRAACGVLLFETS